MEVWTRNTWKHEYKWFLQNIPTSTLCLVDLGSCVYISPIFDFIFPQLGSADLFDCESAPKVPPIHPLPSFLLLYSAVVKRTQEWKEMMRHLSEWLTQEGVWTNTALQVHTTQRFGYERRFETLKSVSILEAIIQVLYFLRRLFFYLWVVSYGVCHIQYFFFTYRYCISGKFPLPDADCTSSNKYNVRCPSIEIILQ